MQTYGRLPVAFVRGEGTQLWDSEGKQYLDFLVGPRGHVARPRAPRGRRRDRRSGAHAAPRVEPLLQRRAAAGGRAAERVARRRRPGVLRELGRRGQRVRDQAGAPIRPAARRPRPLPRDQRVRLVPRPHARDARGHRPAAEAGDVPAAARGFRQVAFDDLDALAAALDDRVAAVHARGRAGRGRRGARVARVPPGRAPALRRARGAADHRRGAVRARSHREVVRLRARGHRARRRHDGEGARQRRADRCVLGPRRGCRRVRARRPRHDVRRSAARGTRRARDARGDGARTRSRACGAGRRAALRGLAEGRRRRRRARRGPARSRPSSRPASTPRPSRSGCLDVGPRAQRGHRRARCAWRRRCS